MAFVGVASASLMPACREWAPSVALSFVVFLLLLSVPLAQHHRALRAYFTGFAFVGWGYMLIAFSPWFESNVGRQLIAHPIAEAVCFATTDSLGDAMHFLKVSHALLMFLAAHIGGSISQHFDHHQSSEEENDRPT